ncbi:hypothetical protein C8R46DRAFT_1205580 [Mycena filopes]|nr:hypothetical protein C8R46DRAFT_1205580 [Mycena filopes]
MKCLLTPALALPYILHLFTSTPPRVWCLGCYHSVFGTFTPPPVSTTHSGTHSPGYSSVRPGWDLDISDPHHKRKSKSKGNGDQVAKRSKQAVVLTSQFTPDSVAGDLDASVNMLTKKNSTTYL